MAQQVCERKTEKDGQGIKVPKQFGFAKHSALSVTRRKLSMKNTRRSDTLKGDSICRALLGRLSASEACL